MSTNPHDSIYPTPEVKGFNKNSQQSYIVAGASTGLTKREDFAKAALQGILASNPDALFPDAAMDAVGYADALISALNNITSNKTTTGGTEE